MGECSRWRHFRMRLHSSIPSFLPFGKFLVHVRYNGQTRTCHHCHLPVPSHLANSCPNQCCYNCDESGHLSSVCPHPVMCNICKATDHKEMPVPFPGHVMFQQLHLGMRILGLRPHRPLPLLIIPPMPT